jgi:hypothetical protein
MNSNTRQLKSAVINAQFAAFHGLTVALLPFDDARPTTQIRALVTSGTLGSRKGGGLPSAARRRALRSGCDSLGAHLRLRSTSPARRRSPKRFLPFKSCAVNYFRLIHAAASLSRYASTTLPKFNIISLNNSHD